MPTSFTTTMASHLRSASKNNAKIGNRAVDPEGSLPSTVSGHEIDSSASSMIKELLPLIKNSVDGLKESIVASIKDEILAAMREEMNVIRGELKEAKNEIEELKARLDLQDDHLSELKNEIEVLNDHCNERERHSRSWNLIWLTNKQEKSFETADETASVVKNFFNQVPEIKNRNVVIDIAHRMGPKKDGKPRKVIVRLASKADVSFVLRYKQQLRSLNQGLIFQDLTKKDRLNKAKHSAEIHEIVKQGNKAKFSNGFWIVNGRRFKDSDFQKISE